jgi:hypothetical protein
MRRVQNCLVVACALVASTSAADPAPVASACTTLNRCVTVLATGQAPFGIATDGARVYWADRARNAIVMAPTSGSASTVVVDGQPSPTLDGLVGSRIVWHTPTEIRQVSWTGGTVERFREGTIGAVSVRDPWIAWTEDEHGLRVCWAKSADGADTSNPLLTVNAQSAFIGFHGVGIVFDPSSSPSAVNGYVTSSSRMVSHFPLVSSMDLRGVFALAVDTSFLYVRVGHDILRLSKVDFTPTVLANQQDTSGKLVLDGTTLYWTNPTTGTVSSMSNYGGSLATLASGKPGAMDLAVDANNVYFTTSNAIVRVTPK